MASAEKPEAILAQIVAIRDKWKKARGLRPKERKEILYAVDYVLRDSREYVENFYAKPHVSFMYIDNLKKALERAKKIY